ncbi:MAG: flagellar biosynthesis anti-sigma factor FlgM [Rhizobacter sp.]
MDAATSGSLEIPMKIGNPTDKPVVPTPAVASAAAEPAKLATQPAAVPVAAAPDASATVALSSTASTLLSSGSSAEFDADKVARISQAISDGTFKIDAGVIADRLISNAQELLTKGQR